MKDLISIIIPVYNSAKYLSKCLDSVIGQTYRKIEIIAINDGSTDNSLAILREFEKKDNRIIVLDKKNAGVSEARNDGINASKGDYIMFVDSDDWIDDDYIELLYKEMKEKQLDICRSGFMVDKSDCSIKNSLTDEDIYIDADNFKENFIDTTFFHSACVQLIKNDILKNNNIRFDKDIAYEEDLLFNIKLFKYAKRIRYVNCHKYHYIANETSATRELKNVGKIILSVLKATDEIKRYANNFDDVKFINGKNIKIIIMYMYLLLKKDRKQFSQICKSIDKSEWNKIFSNYKLLDTNFKQALKIKIVIFLMKLEMRDKNEVKKKV